MKAEAGSIELLISTVPNDIYFQKYVSCVERGWKFIQVGMPEDEDTLKLNINELDLLYTLRTNSPNSFTDKVNIINNIQPNNCHFTKNKSFCYYLN